MRRRLDITRIYHQPFVIRFFHDPFQQPLPNPLVPPTAEAPMGVLPVAVIRWQVPPRRPGTKNPEHCIEETPIVLGDPSPLASSTGQMRLQQGPSEGHGAVPGLGDPAVPGHSRPFTHSVTASGSGCVEGNRIGLVVSERDTPVQRLPVRNVESREQPAQLSPQAG